MFTCGNMSNVHVNYSRQLGKECRWDKPRASPSAGLAFKICKNIKCLDKCDKCVAKVWKVVIAALPCF